MDSERNQIISERNNDINKGSNVNYAQKLKNIIDSYAPMIATISIIAPSIYFVTTHYATVQQLKNVECMAERALKMRSLPLEISILMTRIEVKKHNIRNERKMNEIIGVVRIDYIDEEKEEMKDLLNTKRNLDNALRNTVEDLLKKCKHVDVE